MTVTTKPWNLLLFIFVSKADVGNDNSAIVLLQKDNHCCFSSKEMKVILFTFSPSNVRCYWHLEHKNQDTDNNCQLLRWRLGERMTKVQTSSVSYIWLPLTTLWNEILFKIGSKLGMIWCRKLHVSPLHILTTFCLSLYVWMGRCLCECVREFKIETGNAYRARKFYKCSREARWLAERLIIQW